MLYNFLLKELDDASKWEDTKYCLRHKKSKQEVWIGSSENYHHFDTYPFTKCFDDQEKKILFTKAMKIKNYFKDTGLTQVRLDVMSRWGIKPSDVPPPYSGDDAGITSDSIITKIAKYVKKFKIKLVYK